MPKRFDEQGMAEYREFNALVGARLKRAREENALTQNDLARMIGREKVWLSTIELGRFGLNAMDLGKIAEALGRPLSYFYGGSSEPQAIVPKTYGDWLAMFPNADRARAHYELDRVYEKLERQKEKVLA